MVVPVAATTASRLVASGLTLIPDCVPVIELVIVSVALIDCVPAVRRVALKVWVPLSAAVKV